MKEHFRQRLEQCACLVFYDPEGRYREIVDDLGLDDCRVIDGGANWPKLRSLLNVESSSEILTALLSPFEKQREALEHCEACRTQHSAVTFAGSLGHLSFLLFRFFSRLLGQ